jgi:hypothetical protein
MRQLAEQRERAAEELYQREIQMQVWLRVFFFSLLAFIVWYFASYAA